MVVATLQEGLKDCYIVDSRTPNWALRELRDIHNSCHGGSESSMVDLICHGPDVEQATRFTTYFMIWDVGCLFGAGQDSELQTAQRQHVKFPNNFGPV